VGERHGVTAGTQVTAEIAAQVARMMTVLTAPSRVRIVACLRDRPCSVGELTDAVEMAQPAVSHQLRILRDLGLVSTRRNGRHIVYELFDPHVAILLEEALRHIEHVKVAATPASPPDAVAEGKVRDTDGGRT